MNTCYALACGPSIKQQDLSYLSGKPCVTISNFFVHPEFQNMDVKYHIFGELHDPITYEMGLAWFKEAQKAFKVGQKIMVNERQRNLVNHNNLFSEQEIVYWTTGGNFPSTLPHRVGPALSISLIATQMAVFVAMNSNLKNVILMGIDHSWVNHVGESKHFYEEKESVLVRMGYNEWFNISNKADGEIMERNNLATLASNYQTYYQLAHNLGITIYNGTPGSMITNLPYKGFTNE